MVLDIVHVHFDCPVSQNLGVRGGWGNPVMRAITLNQHSLEAGRDIGVGVFFSTPFGGWHSMDWVILNTANRL